MARADVDEVVRAQLIEEALAAPLRHPADRLVQLHAARALLRAARAGEPISGALLASEAVSVCVGLLQQPSPCREIACAALDALCSGGGGAGGGGGEDGGAAAAGGGGGGGAPAMATARGCAALVHQGAVVALLAVAASPSAAFAWRRQCARVVMCIASETADVSVLRSVAAAGLVAALTAIAADDRADAPLCVQIAHTFGGLTWRAASAAVRREITAQLAAASAPSALIAAAARHPSRRALATAAARLIGEEWAPPPRRSEPFRWRRSAGPDGEFARKPTPAVPVPGARRQARARARGRGGGGEARRRGSGPRRRRRGGGARRRRRHGRRCRRHLPRGD